MRYYEAVENCKAACQRDGYPQLLFLDGSGNFTIRRIRSNMEPLEDYERALGRVDMRRDYWAGVDYAKYKELKEPENWLFHVNKLTDFSIVDIRNNKSECVLKMRLDERIREKLKAVYAVFDKYPITNETRDDGVFFKTDLITVLWTDTRMEMLDSDGQYIEYLFYIEDEQDSFAEAVGYYEMFYNATEESIVRYISHAFNVLTTEKGCDKQRFAELREKYGDDFVCRIGSTAIIIQE